MRQEKPEMETKRVKNKRTNRTPRRRQRTH